MPESGDGVEYVAEVSYDKELSADDIVELIESIIHEHGKIMEHQSLVEKAQEVTHEDTHDNHIEFVLHVSDRLILKKKISTLRKAGT